MALVSTRSPYSSPYSSTGSAGAIKIKIRIRIRITIRIRTGANQPGSRRPGVDLLECDLI